MKQIIISIIGNLICYFIGFWLGYKIQPKKPRAYVKLHDDLSGELHSNKISDDIIMLSTILFHLEKEGYNMDDVKTAFSEAMAAGSPLHEPKKEDDHAE